MCRNNDNDIVDNLMKTYFFSILKSETLAVLLDVAPATLRSSPYAKLNMSLSQLHILICPFNAGQGNDQNVELFPERGLKKIQCFPATGQRCLLC